MPKFDMKSSMVLLDGKYHEDDELELEDNMKEK